MRLIVKSLLTLSLAFAFMARGAAYACSPRPSAHDCCGKPVPAAPKTPCPEMACCQVVLPTAAPTSQIDDLAIILPVAAFLAPPLDGAHAVPSFSDGGPPGPRLLPVSDRSPPVLLG